MKNKNVLLGLFSLLLISTACSDDSSSKKSDNLKIVAKASYSGSNARMNSDVVVTEFKINLKEIEFELNDDFYDDDDDDYGDGFYGDDDDIELSGPFELDLLNGQTTITSIYLPDGVYKEVEFKMDKNNNSTSEMFNKSIQIKGTIQGTPFVFWHNVEEEFEIDYEDAGQNLIISDNSAVIVFDFNLNAVLANVDLTLATDGNNDGLIEISPNDPDGNQNLANIIKNKIKEFTDLLDD